MAEPDHHHDARARDGGDAGPERFADPGSRHLAAALRTSCRLLGAIMLFGVAVFLAMGFQFVRPGEVAIRSVFGRVVGITPEGLAYNWPAPIGRIDKVNVGERTIAVDDFWMNETKKDQLQPNLRKREIPKGGLRPGWDGALLTGDRNLLHVRLECKYAVARTGYELPYDDPLVADHPFVKFLRRSPGREETVGQARERWRRDVSQELPPRLTRAEAGRPLRLAARAMRFTCSTSPALLHRMHVRDAGEMVRSALCGAAIRAGAVRTAFGLQRTEQAEFENEVRAGAQATLDAMKSGILVRSVKLRHSTWPLRTLPDYDAAMQAIAQAETLKSKAREVALGLLNSTAGPVAAGKLAGDLEDVVDPAAAAAVLDVADGRIAATNLIGQYNEAVRRGRDEIARQLLERIENVLVSDELQGQARRVLGEARAARSSIIQGVKSRLERFRKRLSAYRDNPEFVLDRWWMETREEILNSPTAEKHFIMPGGPKTILRISRDPDMARQTDRAWLGSKQGKPGGSD